jgi:hypothetical protein
MCQNGSHIKKVRDRSFSENVEQGNTPSLVVECMKSHFVNHLVLSQKIGNRSTSRTIYTKLGHILIDVPPYHKDTCPNMVIQKLEKKKNPICLSPEEWIDK